MFELKIRLKGEDRTFTKDECVHDRVTFSEDDALLEALVATAQKEFSLPVEEITLTAKMSWPAPDPGGE